MSINTFKHELIQLVPWLGKFLRVQYGLIEEDLKKEDYIMGANKIFKKILRPDGNWEQFLPTEERQSGRRIETMACTIFGLWNTIETLGKFNYGEEWDKSDRYNAKKVGITRRGGSMSNALESIRKRNGGVNQDIWPNNINRFSWNEFYAAIPKYVDEKAVQFINDYVLRYEAVWNNPLAIREALKYSPLYCAGYAWYRKANGRYYSVGSPNHVFEVYKMDSDDNYYVFDTYPPFKKVLDKSFKIAFPKLLTLRKRQSDQFDERALKSLWDRGLRYVMRVLANGEIYKIVKNGAKFSLQYLSAQEWNNHNVELSSQSKKLVGVNEDFFNSLIIT